MFESSGSVKIAGNFDHALASMTSGYARQGDPRHDPVEHAKTDGQPDELWCKIVDIELRQTALVFGSLRRRMCFRSRFCSYGMPLNRELPAVWFCWF